MSGIRDERTWPGRLGQGYPRFHLGQAVSRADEKLAAQIADAPALKGWRYKPMAKIVAAGDQGESHSFAVARYLGG